jgi:hypothetical protein
VSADREPENIAATIQHELVHGAGPPSARSDRLGPFGEQCAVKAEISTARIFGAAPDRVSPNSPVDPRSNCR